MRMLLKQDSLKSYATRKHSSLERRFERFRVMKRNKFRGLGGMLYGTVRGIFHEEATQPQGG